MNASQKWHHPLMGPSTNPIGIQVDDGIYVYMNTYTHTYIHKHNIHIHKKVWKKNKKILLIFYTLQQPVLFNFILFVINSLYFHSIIHLFNLFIYLFIVTVAFISWSIHMYYIRHMYNMPPRHMIGYTHPTLPVYIPDVIFPWASVYN